jgi:hypothetical protein
MFQQIRTSYEEVGDEIVSLIGDLECTIALRCLRTNPQPFLLTFGVCFPNLDLIRSFEFGGGVGVSKSLHANAETTIFDERCSLAIGTAMRSDNPKYIRKTDHEHIRGLFDGLSKTLSQQRIDATAHIILKTSARHESGSCPPLILGFGLSLERLALYTSASFRTGRSSDECETRLDWLLVPSAPNNLMSSRWKTNVEMFWFHSFPGMEIKRHDTRVLVTWRDSPRNLLITWKMESFEWLFRLCMESHESSKAKPPPAKQRKRQKLNPGMGDAYKTGPRQPISK